MNYALPETRLRFAIIEDTTGAPDGNAAAGARYTIADAEASLVHSAERQYTFQYDPSSGSNDVITVKTDDSGFLELVSINREDRTGDIISDAADLLRTMATGLPVDQRTSSVRDAEAARLVTFQFNPESDLDHINGQLRRFGLSASVEGGCPTGPSALIQAPADAATTPPPVNHSPVIYYTRNTPRLLQISRGTAVIAVVEFETTNCGVGVFDIGQFDWIDSELKLTFVAGALTEAIITKPSETEEIIAVPVTIVNAVLGAVSDVLTLRVRRISSDAELLEAQAKLLEAQATFLQRQRAFEEERRRATDPRTETLDTEEGAGGVPD